MGHKSYSGMAQEAARTESLYGQRIKHVKRAGSFREVLRLAQVPPRPDLRAFPLQGPKALQKAVVARLIELANLGVRHVAKQETSEAKLAAHRKLISEAAVLESGYSWLYRQIFSESVSRIREPAGADRKKV